MTTRRGSKIKQQRLDNRDKFWPDVSKDRLWFRKANKGFTTIPRGLSLVTRIMDAMSPGKPLAGTYYALWCYGQDEMIVTIHKPLQMALESGFTGQRAEYTWRGRMKKLEDLGFIKSRPAFSGPYHFILLLNPYLVVKDLYDQDPDNDVIAPLYNTLVDRIHEIREKTEM
jgi:hypothetical protein